MPLAAYRRILAVSAHPDDAEIGCGGSLAKAVTMGSTVECAVMCRCVDETPKGDKNLRVDECLDAAKILKIRETHVFDFPNRDLPAHMIDLMDRLGELQETFRPDLVIIPWSEDSHQDHAAVGLAAIRTFRRRESILQYEILRYGSHSFTPNLFTDISETLDTKLRALDCFKSQSKQRAYFDKESFRGLARTRGAQVGCDYAEGFLAYKLLW